MRNRNQLLLACALLIACRSDGLEEGRVPGLARELIVPDGAVHVRSARHEGFERVTFSIGVPFPASNVINSTAAQLSKYGLRPARNEWLNTGYSSEYLRGWTESTVVSKPGGKERFMRRWSAQWSNDAGDVVSYTFFYLSPGETLTNTTNLEVQAERMNKAVAD